MSGDDMGFGRDMPGFWTPEMHEEFKRYVDAHPELKVTTTKPPARSTVMDDFVGGAAFKYPTDAVIRLRKGRGGSDPQYHIHYVQKNRFPNSFPDKLIYDKGFGPSVTREWLQKNVAEYSGVTFEEVTCNGMGWVGGAGRCVELQGQPVPGTMVIERGAHRADLDGRTGIVVGALSAPCIGPLNVMWGPWRFKDDT